ncbi:MAG: Two-component transcriptional regulator, CheY-like receiver domain [bacterium]|nr:Two-component transcriptional regulator, CheY-like receiver domain [bacterium]
MLERGLTEEGYETVVVGDAESALLALRQDHFDVCVLDVLLPLMDGFAALTAARQQGIVTPVLLLTARDGVADRVRGLQLGADDYLVKPFAFAELLARLQAIHRRAGPHRAAVLSAGGLTIDPAAHRVIVGEAAVELSQKQFALLELLLRNRGQVVTRAMILEKVFGYSFASNTNIVDVHISHLRQKLTVPGCALRIETVRGVGYRAEAEVAA